MDWTFFVENRESILGYAGTFGALSGALAAAVWFFLQRHLARQIEFDVDARILRSDGPTVAEYTLTLKNCGKVRVKLPSLLLRVRSFNQGDKIEKFDEARLAFSHKLFTLGNVLPRNADFDFTFMEPGVTQHYRVVSDVPTEARFLLVFGKFEYRKGWPHTAERVVEVK